MIGYITVCACCQRSQFDVASFPNITRLLSFLFQLRFWQQLCTLATASNDNKFHGLRVSEMHTSNVMIVTACVLLVKSSLC